MIEKTQVPFYLYGLTAIAASLTMGGARSALLLLGVVILGCLLAFEFSIVPVDQRMAHNPLAFLLAAYVAILLQHLLLGSGTGQGLLRSFAGGLIIAIASMLATRRRAISKHTLLTLLKLNIMASLAVGAASGTILKECRDDKCTAFGSLLRGGFVHENYMGYSASVLLLMSVTTMLVRSRRSVLPGVFWSAVALLCIYWSGSRVSLGISLVAIALAVLFQRNTRVRILVVALPIVSMSVLGVYLLAAAESADFTSRGRRWVAIRENLGGVLSPTGRGFGAWQELVATVVGETTPHSTYGAVLIHGGLLALIPFVMFLVGLSWNSLRSGSASLYAVSAYLAGRSVFETIWNPAALNEQLWLLLLFGLAAVGEQRVHQRTASYAPQVPVKNSPRSSHVLT